MLASSEHTLLLNGVLLDLVLALRRSETAPLADLRRSGGKALGYFPDRVAELRAAAPRPSAPPASSIPRPATTAPPNLPAPRFALAVDERELRLLRDSLLRVDEALSDAYEAIDRHQQAGRCRFDLDGLPMRDLEFLRKLILRERPSPARSDPVGQ